MRHSSIKEGTCRYLFNALSFSNLNCVITESLKFQAGRFSLHEMGHGTGLL